MAISGLGQNYYQNNVATTKSTKDVNSTEKFALEKTSGTQELSEAEEMELFKKEFYARSQNSFFKKTSDKEDRQKELLEKYLEKRAQVKKQQQELLNEKIAKQELERSRLSKSWNSERQMAKASSAYDANIMTGTAASGDFMLG